MALKEQIEGDIKKAMLARDKDSLRALRAVKSLILLAETEKGAAQALTPEAEIKLLQKAAKQRKESIEIYAAQGREDLKKVESDELLIIEKYLPQQLGDEELTEKLKNIVSKVGAKGPSDIGKVMGVATKELAGLADGKVVSEKVKQLLSIS